MTENGIRIRFFGDTYALTRANLHLNDLQNLRTCRECSLLNRVGNTLSKLSILYYLTLVFSVGWMNVDLPLRSAVTHINLNEHLPSFKSNLSRSYLATIGRFSHPVGHFLTYCHSTEWSFGAFANSVHVVNGSTRSALSWQISNEGYLPPTRQLSPVLPSNCHHPPADIRHRTTVGLPTVLLYDLTTFVATLPLSACM